MAAARNRVFIDEKIAKAEETVVKTKEKYTEAVKKLEELMAKKKAIQSEELMKLFENSNRTYEEVVEFLKAGMDTDQIKKTERKKTGRKPKSGV